MFPPLLLALLVLVAGETFTVNTTDDAGPGSLRWAIASANEAPGPDTVRFRGVCPPIYHNPCLLLHTPD